MTFTDIAELKIRILGQDAVKTFDSLNASAKDVKDQLKEMELMGKKNTEEYKELARVQRDIQQELKKTTQGIDVQNASMRELEALMKRKNQELKLLKVGSAEWIAKLKEIEPVRDRIAEVNQQVRGLDNTTKSQEAGWTKYAGLVKAAFVVGVVIEFAKQIFSAGMEVFNLTAKFEKYETVLKNALGSQDKATAALKMLKDIAATTPFSLDEMTASFNKMVNRGLLPTSGEMKKLSDLAASQGKSFDQLTEAVLDAQMGEAERLKEFGIKMKKEGDNVSLSFKGQTTSVKNNEKAIYEAIVAMGEYNGVAGVTSEVSADLAGKQSNLGDKIDFVTVTLGEKLKPAFHFILDLFVKGVDFVARFIDKIGPLGVIVETVADTFGGLWNIGKELFFKMFPQAQGQVFDMGKAVKVLGTVLYAVLIPFQLLRAVVVGLIDAYRVLGNATIMVGKALKGDFEGAKAEAKQLETSWNNLKKNGTDNFGAIAKGFNKIWTDSSADMKNNGNDWDKHVEKIKKGQKDVTAVTKEESEKRTAAEKKAAKEREEIQYKERENLLKTEKIKADLMKKGFEKEYELLRIDYEQKELKATKEIEDQKQLDEYLLVLVEKYLQDRNALIKKYDDLDASYQTINRKNALEQVKEIPMKTIQLEEWKAGKIKQLNELVDKQRKESWDAEAKRIEESKRQLTNQVQMGMQAIDSLMQKTDEFLNKIIATSDDTNKRMAASLGKEFMKPFQENMNAAKALMSGDFVGAAEGVFGYFKGMWNMTVKLKETLREIKEEEFWRMFNEGFEKVNQYADQIKKTFDTLVDDSETFKNGMSDKTGIEGVIETQIKLGDQIKANYNTAVEKENNYSTTVKKNIEDAYNLEIKRINDKYDLLAQKTTQQYNADSLAITEGVNNQLMGFVSSQDLQLKLTTQYEGEKNKIRAQFAHLIKPIVEGMTQAEIDGINEATNAQNAAFAKLAEWQTGQIQFVLDHGKLERDTFNDTQKIIADGKDAQYQLSLKFQAQEIANNIAKNTEIEAAEKNRNKLIEIESKRHNDEITRLGIEKDAALLASFNTLKDAMKAGYTEILAAANEAYRQGIITADQYAAAVQRVINLKNMLGDGNSLSEDINERIRKLKELGTPGFAAGTEYLDPKGIYPAGTDKIPIMADRGERIIDKYSNAQLGGISNRELVNMVKRSNLYRNGPNVSTTAGMVNLASPASVQQATHITNNLSTTALEAAVAQMSRELQAQSKYLEVIADKDPSINFHALSNAFKESAAITARSSF